MKSYDELIVEMEAIQQQMAEAKNGIEPMYTALQSAS